MGKLGFVMPFWTDGADYKARYLVEAVHSILRQTSDRWVLYIVDDASDPQFTSNLFQEVFLLDKRIRILRSEINKGPGHCRNVGIEQAFQDDCSAIGFIDADDISPSNRATAVLDFFNSNSDVSVCYSGFNAIDENGSRIPPAQLIEGMRLLNEQLESCPLDGYEIWKEVLCYRDGLTIPSSLNVKINLAMSVPFPSEFRFHEDTHTWVRYSAFGAQFKYLKGVEAGYRVLDGGRTSESRKRSGGIDKFNEIRRVVSVDSVVQSLALAARRGNVSEHDALTIRVRHLKNLASIIEKEGSSRVSQLLSMEAAEIEERLHLVTI